MSDIGDRHGRSACESEIENGGVSAPDRVVPRKKCQVGFGLSRR